MSDKFRARIVNLLNLWDPALAGLVRLKTDPTHSKIWGAQSLSPEPARVINIFRSSRNRGEDATQFAAPLTPAALASSAMSPSRLPWSPAIVFTSSFSRWMLS